MSYKDKDKDKDKDQETTFPTRFGTPQGTAKERAMLDIVGGSGGIRTRIERGANGEEVLLRTKAGMPRFITEKDTAQYVQAACPASDNGFVNSAYNITGSYFPPEDTSKKLYKLFDSSGGIKTAKYAMNSITRKESLMWKGGSLFSGLMRRVAQLENGKYKGPKISATESLGEGESPFSPGFEVTDGLFLGTANYGIPTRWVIRVQNSGVYRIPVTFCKDLPVGWKAQEQNWLNTLTEEKAHKAISPYWTVKKVAFDEAVKIGDAPPYVASGFSPFYTWCGWAFDYTGHRATIVCSGVLPGETWLTNRRYEMTVMESVGIPVSATFATLDEGRFVNPNNDGTPYSGNARMQAATILPGYLSTVIFHDAIHYPASAPDQDTPVFSYYEESGGLVVVNYFYKNGQSGVKTDTFQTPQISYSTPVGTFQTTSAASGSPVTYPIDPGPPVPRFNTYSTGPVFSTKNGLYGKTDSSYYSAIIDYRSETENALVTDVGLEDAGYGYIQNDSDFFGGRMIGESLIFCTKADYSSVYRPNGWMYPYGIGPGDPINNFLQCSVRRSVNFCWQTTSTYSHSTSSTGVILLHGFDRESFAIVSQTSMSTGAKTTTRDTSGTIAEATLIPNGEYEILIRSAWTAFSPTGMVFHSVSNSEGTFEDVSVGGFKVEPSVAGKVVAVGSPLHVSGGTTYESATGSTTITLTVRVGGQTFSNALAESDAFNVYAGGDRFMFRACASAFGSGKIVRQTGINKPLVTENIGGCVPHAGITTFIGVL